MSSSTPIVVAHLLEGDPLPDSPFEGRCARYVWECLREAQRAYQERSPGWWSMPAEFDRLTRVLPAAVALDEGPGTATEGGVRSGTFHVHRAN